MGNGQFGFSYRNASSSRARASSDPLKILICADTAISTSVDGDQPLRPYRVDLDTFDNLMATMLQGFSLPIVFRDEPYAASLELKDIDSFNPDSIARNIPLIRQLRKLHKALGDSDRTDDATAELTLLLGGEEPSADREPSATKEPSARSDVEQSDFSRLLGETADSGRKEAGSRGVRGLIERIMEDEGSSATLHSRTDLATAVDEACEDLVRQVLKAPEFRALERTWRGLHWLVSTIDLDEAIELWLLPMNFTNDSGHMLGAETPVADTELYQLISRAGAGVENNGYTVVALDCELRTPQDLDILEKFSEIAEQLDITVLASAPSAVADGITPREIIESNQPLNEKWSALQKSNAAHRLAVAFPRLLLRLPYGRRGEASDMTNFEEFAPDPDHEAFLWGNPIYGLILLIGREFESDGWGFNLGEGLEIDDMPLALYDDGTGEAIKPPAETYLSDQDVALLEARGVMTFVSYRNRNTVRLMRFHSVTG